MSTLRVRGLKHDTSALEVDNLSIESNGSGVSLRAASDLRLTLGSEGTVGANTSNWVRAAGQKLMLNAVNDFDVETNGTLRLRIQGSNGNLQFNSGYGSVATAFGCRAWANFDGFALTVRASGNFSSIARIAAGVYAANFTTAMPDTNYCVVGTCCGAGGARGDDSVFSLGGTVAGTTSQITQIRTLINPGTSGRVNVDSLMVSVFR